MAKIAIQKKYNEPNAVFAPTIIINSYPLPNGKLRYGCRITVAAAYVTDEDGPNENWSVTGQTATISITDIENLPDDLKALSAGVGGIKTTMTTLIDTINKIRKIV